MKPTIGIIGFPKTISIAQKVARGYRDRSRFIFITSILDDSIDVIARHEKNGLDILIAGPGNSHILKKHVRIPVITFSANTQTLIRAILNARKITNRIAIIQAKSENYDFPFFESLLGVHLSVYSCNTMADYRRVCMRICAEGFKAIIGGSYAVDLAKSSGIEGFFFYNQQKILKNAIERALEWLDQYNRQLEKISQMNILLQQSNDALFVLDDQSRITFINRAVVDKLHFPANDTTGKPFYDFFTDLPKTSSGFNAPAELFAKRGNQDIVLNFYPVMVKAHAKGEVVVARLVREIEEAERRVRKKIHRRGFESKYTFNDLVGTDPVFTLCIKKSKAFARSHLPILIIGETGTGKEMFAQAIHNLSNRREYPFVAINCATLPTELIESELFGYEKGAFSGARAKGKTGLVELAHRGTLFLDEIYSLDYALQAKLLRLLQEKEFIRVGGGSVMPVDVRIISATNTDLIRGIKKGRFRRDLYYRLNTLMLKLPALRERKADLWKLFLFFLKRAEPRLIQAVESKKKWIRRELNRRLFLGNVRELNNIVERFCILAAADLFDREDRFDAIMKECFQDEDALDPSGEITSEQIRFSLKKNLKASVQEAERAILLHYRGNYSKPRELADDLEIERSTLWRKLKKHGLSA